MFNKVLLSIDAAVPVEANDLIRRASDLATSWAAELHVCSIVPDVKMAIVGTQFADGFEADSLAAAHKEVEQLCEAAGAKADIHVRFGTVYDQVINLAEELDASLIVVGGGREDLKDYLLGSNAARIVRHSDRSVMVLR